MENSTGQRLRQLRAHYNLSVKEFAVKCGLSHVAIFQMENGKTLKPHKSTLLRISAIFGTTIDWILYGKNEMLPNGSRELGNDQQLQDNFWKNEAYLELKSKNLMLEKEIERLWQMIHSFSGIKKSRFDHVLDVG
jgi:transcriptional regulator with XRE-family HTH domain